MKQEIRVRWDTESNPQNPGWTYFSERANEWFAIVDGPTSPEDVPGLSDIIYSEPLSFKASEYDDDRDYDIIVEN